MLSQAVQAQTMLQQMLDTTKRTQESFTNIQKAWRTIRTAASDYAKSLKDIQYDLTSVPVDEIYEAAYEADITLFLKRGPSLVLVTSTFLSTCYVPPSKYAEYKSRIDASVNAPVSTSGWFGNTEAGSTEYSTDTNKVISKLTLWTSNNDSNLRLGKLNVVYTDGSDVTMGSSLNEDQGNFPSHILTLASADDFILGKTSFYGLSTSNLLQNVALASFFGQSAVGGVPRGRDFEMKRFPDALFRVLSITTKVNNVTNCIDAIRFTYKNI